MSFTGKRVLLLVVASGRRWGVVPLAKARWIPREFDPDKSTWRPVYTAYGLTSAHAASRAKRKEAMDL